ncbi:F0F1 ATP synthase subunit A [Scatolibacter rhodanostii]|uniref:F0F1 ATP synthase subunit A n=1 Tax=Scatolibacter rhodanostii TaxID=2014781 RepID=UPI000C07A739|nr:F0F1 ATP synthase subunit A [Scatolibacter rhodanostii]
MKVEITGAKIFFTIPYLNIPITETLVNAWIVMALLVAACIWMTKGMKVRANTKKQHLAEFLVNTVNKWVLDNMGERYAKSSFPPFIAALFAFSACSSLLGLFGLYPPTAALSTTLGWSIMVYVMITYTNIRTNKLSGYLKGLTEPVALLTPLNIISEVSTPVSMAFRHFGNIASGQVVSALLYGALLMLNNALFGWLPGALGQILTTIPIAQIGIPAILSIYFDLFSSIMQAFIFCMLTMNYISAAGQTD